MSYTYQRSERTCTQRRRPVRPDAWNDVSETLMYGNPPETTLLKSIGLLGHQDGRQNVVRLDQRSRCEADVHVRIALLLARLGPKSIRVFLRQYDAYYREVKALALKIGVSSSVSVQPEISVFLVLCVDADQL